MTEEFNDNDRALIEEWKVDTIGVNSSFLNREVLTDQDVLDHALACIAWEKDQTAKSVENNNAYQTYLLQCRERREMIALSKKRWKDAIDKKKSVIVEWTLYVEEMRKQYTMIKTSVPPQRPTK